MFFAIDICRGLLLSHRLLVFINPSVASLPKHKHIIGGHGCFKGVLDNKDGGIACSGRDALPREYQSLINCKKTMKPQMLREMNEYNIKWKAELRKLGHTYDNFWDKVAWNCSSNDHIKNSI